MGAAGNHRREAAGRRPDAAAVQRNPANGTTRRRRRPDTGQEARAQSAGEESSPSEKDGQPEPCETLMSSSKCDLHECLSRVTNVDGHSIWPLQINGREPWATTWNAMQGFFRAHLLSVSLTPCLT